MINTYTWTSNPALQNRFDLAREKIAQSSHPLAINYREHFNSNEIIAYSMSCDADHVYLCSSIARKEYWPGGVYRILNRVFKPTPVNIVTKNIESYWLDMIEQQIELCLTFPDFRTAVVSRKLGNIRTLTQLGKGITSRGYVNSIWESPVWMCNDYDNPDCQQNILAVGRNLEHEFNQQRILL